MSQEGDEVRLERKARGLSQAKLAQLAGVDVGTIKRIEAGRTEGSTRLGQVQSYLGVGPYAPDVAPQPSMHRPDPKDIDLGQLNLGQLTALQLVVAQEIAARVGAAADTRPTARARFSEMSPEEQAAAKVAAWVPNPTMRPPFATPDTPETPRESPLTGTT